MHRDRITEEAFLLVELQYSLSQLDVQIATLHERGTPDQALSVAADEILLNMCTAEREFQRAIAQRLETHSHAIDQPAGVDFASLRRRSIAMLGSDPDAWPLGLSGVIKRRVSSDRHDITSLACLRLTEEEN